MYDSQGRLKDGQILPILSFIRRDETTHVSRGPTGIRIGGIGRAIVQREKRLARLLEIFEEVRLLDLNIVETKGLTRFGISAGT